MKPKHKRVGTHRKQKLYKLCRKNGKHSDRTTSCTKKLQGKTSLQIIQVCVPTSDHDETVEKFYEELQKATDKKSCRHNILMGDFNAKI